MRTVDALRLIAAAVLGAGAAPALSGAETADFERCLDAATGTAAADQCYYAEAPRQQARLQAAFDALMAGQPTDVDRQRLAAAQDAWLDYRDAHCAWAWVLPWGDMTEALIPIVCAMHENERRADRFGELQAFFGTGQTQGGTAPTAPSTTAPAATGGFVIADSDVRLLTHAELAALSPSQLRLARNEIYARHGFVFQSADLQAWFAGQPWYRPAGRQVTLSRTEQANVDLIQAVEEGR
ncbi:MAG: YARHG domain-containing protein [Alphaproteobacteria bacterium]